MRRLSSGLGVLALIAFLPGRANAQDVAVPPPPPPWEITGTSTTVAVPDVVRQHRVDHRFFVKSDRLVVKSGFSYLSRGDFYINRGVAVDLSYWTGESFGLDLLSMTLFFSRLGSTADALRKTTGLLPDAQRPYARLTTGGRYAFAYGKLLIEELSAVIHMDASTALHLGTLITDHAPNFAGDLGITFQAAANQRVLVWMEVSYFASYEKRTTSNFASGPMASIGLGLLFF